MKCALFLALVFCLPALAQVDANSNRITIEVGPGNELQEVVRPGTKLRTLKIERNPQDTVTVTYPVQMHQGLRVDRSTLPPLDPGTDEFRVRATTEQPLPSESGAFRTSCQLALLEDTDPIVYPGQPGKSHTHTIFGNKGLTPWTDAQTLQNSGNSTCRGGIANRSAYWIPTMIDTDTFKPLLPESFLIYYKVSFAKGYGWVGPDGVWHPALNPFPGLSDLPTGLKIVAGDPSRQTPYKSGEAFNYRWKCGATFYTSIPQTACPVGSSLVQEIFFPQCWDGQNLDSPDHKSHMAFTVQVKNVGDPRGAWTHAECPASHPKVIPHVSFQITYKVTIDVRRLRLVSDVTTTNLPGITSHGDLFVGWAKDPTDPTGNRTISDVFVENCLRRNKDGHAHLLCDGREIY